MKFARPALWFVAYCCAFGSAMPAADEALEIAVVGQTSRSYRRERLEDGTFHPEGYALANGGAVPGTIRDGSVRRVPFQLLATVVGHHLARQNYFPADRARDADLLIVLHWGSTTGFEDRNYSQSVTRNATAMSALNAAGTKLDAMKHGVLSGTTEEMETLEKERQWASDDLESSLTMTGLENRARDTANLDNARVLGYLDAINARRDVLFSEISGLGHDLMRDVEEPRYYVTISAYDFRAMRDKKKQVLRWVTRISIRAAGNSFDERMAQMIASAANTFGQRRDLSRRYYHDPRVELGDVEFIGIAAPPAAEPVGEVLVK